MARLYKIGSKVPKIDKNVFLAETATIIGDVEIGEFSSVWYNAVLRGDLERIRIGKSTNVQDNVVIHVDRGFPVRIGNRVIVGHSAVLHGCEIGSDVMIGMKSCILNGARIADRCIVAAGSIVPGKEYPPNSVLMGVPAKIVRKIDEKEFKAEITERWREYEELARIHLNTEKI
jgi:carbonic anhydrase/acetyltransferase-like protein (isoleucine patch superfamily)